MRIDFDDVVLPGVETALQVPIHGPQSVYKKNPLSMIKDLVDASIQSLRELGLDNDMDFEEYETTNSRDAFVSQLMAEVAVSNWLGYDIVDWSVYDTRFLDNSGMNKFGYNIGVVGAVWEEFPVLPPSNEEFSRSQIICYPNSPNNVLIFGIASKRTVGKYCITEEVDTQGVFFGFNKLIPFSSEKYNNVKKLPGNIRKISTPSQLKKFS